MENLIGQLSNRCSRESCRFYSSGYCQEPEERRKCLQVLLTVVPDQEDRAQIAQYQYPDKEMY